MADLVARIADLEVNVVFLDVCSGSIAVRNGV